MLKICGNKFDKNFWLATFSLVGTTIGAGIFSLPYAFAKAGFIIGFIEFTVLVGVVLLIQQMLGEITLQTEDKKRLAGLTASYLGNLWGNLVMASVLFGGAGTLLIYIILGGGFLSLIAGLDIFWSSMIFFALWFVAILVRPRNFGRMEFYVSSLVIFIIVLVAVFNFGSVNFNNFRGFDIKNSLVPYGVILFAMTGYSVIPKMEDLLGGNKHNLKKAIKYGTLIPAIVYLLFVFIILGVSGKLTSPEAISGFSQALNSNFIMYAGALLGLLAVAGAALSYGVYFRETLWYDLKLNKNFAWLITGLIPLSLFIFGARDIIPVVSIVGALFFGFQAFVILLIYKKIKKSKNILYYAAGAIMLFGAALEVWFSFVPIA
ncbi:MAG: aromatic amino acid transport family protein [Patescibacteria group bacterium]